MGTQIPCGEMKGWQPLVEGPPWDFTFSRDMYINKSPTGDLDVEASINEAQRRQRAINVFVCNK